VNGSAVEVGKRELFAAGLPDEIEQSVSRLQSAGRTTMIVRRDKKFLGVIGLMDTPRESARRMIEKMHEMGIARLIMISGDNQQVADAVAGEVGIDQAMGNLMPDDKVEAIRRLREEGEVAMIGDGVNDAPALAHATVGIAMGAAGSDVALETADVALMSDDLALIPFVFGLSRQTSRIIRQNIWISLGMVALLVPSTLFGLKMGAAVFLHEGSTIFVVLNALRLLGWRIKE
jgi:Cd2+/Zn2+-exporting ATPase